MSLKDKILIENPRKEKKMGLEETVK